MGRVYVLDGGIEFDMCVHAIVLQYERDCVRANLHTDWVVLEWGGVGWWDSHMHCLFAMPTHS